MSEDRRVSLLTIPSVGTCFSLLTMTAPSQWGSRSPGGIAAVARMSRRFPSLCLTCNQLLRVCYTCGLTLCTPAGPLCAWGCCSALSTRPSPLIGLSSGFADAMQRGPGAKGKAREACWALPAPRRGFSHACPALMTSFDVPEAAQPGCQLCVTACVTLKGLGFTLCTKITPEARPGTRFSFWSRKERIPLPPSLPSQPGQHGFVWAATVLLSLSPLSHLHPALPRTSKGLAGALFSPHSELVGLLHFPMGLAKMWGKPSLLSHHRHAILYVVASGLVLLIWCGDFSLGCWAWVFLPLLFSHVVILVYCCSVSYSATCIGIDVSDAGSSLLLLVVRAQGVEILKAMMKDSRDPVTGGPTAYQVPEGALKRI